MNKKGFLLLIILLTLTFNTYAQVTETTEEQAKNNISVLFGFFGIEGSYERIFNNNFSLLLDASYTTLIFMDETTASLKARWYPFGKAFYLDMGLGYTYGKGAVGFMADMILGALTFGIYWLVKDYEDDIFKTGGFLIQPGLGWKIDIGKTNAFVLPIDMGLDIKVNSEFPDVMPYLRIGVGYSF